MDFSLPFDILPFEHKVQYNQKLFFIGSCFSENIGMLMKKYKFDVSINPTGILYNPLSIAHSLKRIIENNKVTPDEVFYANDTWNHFDFHSRYSTPNKQTLINNLNQGINEAHSFLKQSEWLFITFGSSFAYQLKSTQQIVGNCHKQRQDTFTKRLLNIDDIVDEYKALLSQLKDFNSSIKLLFTISPVRYIRDGVVENNRSKARLIEATHRLTAEHSNAFYFPAYELVNDVLRDYRYFKTDMVHPSEQAIEFVFQKLKESIFDPNAQQLFDRVKKIIEAKQHQPFNEKGEGYGKFKAYHLKYCKDLIQQYPFLQLKEEMDYFQ